MNHCDILKTTIIYQKGRDHATRQLLMNSTTKEWKWIEDMKNKPEKKTIRITQQISVNREKKMEEKA